MIRVIVFGLLLAVYPKLLNANADLNQSVRDPLNIFLDNESPKRGEEITFNVSSTKKGILKVKCDQEISFKKIDKCKLEDSTLECNVSDDSLNLIAKANGYGLKICEFSLNNQQVHPIPIDIKREKKANITLFVSSSSDRVANLDEFDIKIDLNGSKQKSDTLYQQRMQKLYDLMVWVSVTVAIPTTFLADWVIVILYGNDFEASATALS